MEEVLINLAGDELSEYFEKNLVSIEELCNAISDLIYEKGVLEEKIQDLEEDIRDNYNPKSPYEIYGINESEFH